jgi:hypothetical protein
MQLAILPNPWPQAIADKGLLGAAAFGRNHDQQDIRHLSMRPLPFVPLTSESVAD